MASVAAAAAIGVRPGGGGMGGGGDARAARHRLTMGEESNRGKFWGGCARGAAVQGYAPSMTPLLQYRIVGAVFAAAALAVVALADCSGDDPRVGSTDASTDVTTRIDSPEEPFNFDFDVMGCPANVPNGPCNEVNRVCPAAASDCEPCIGGFVHRTATCVCGGFWNCDQCAYCRECDAGIIYEDPMCTIPAPIRDSGADVRFWPDSGLDAGEDGGGDADLDALGDAADATAD